MTLPKQFPSWYAFWLDVKNDSHIPEGRNRRVHFPSGDVSEDGETLFDTYDLTEIKAKALDEVSKFLPTNADEVFMQVAASNLLEDMKGEKRTYQWYEFHKLLSQ